MKKRKASTLIYLLAFFIIFLAFCAFAVDGTIVFAQRARFQNAIEAAALAGASAYGETGNLTDAQSAAIANFNMWKYGSLQYAKLDGSAISVDSTTKEVLIDTHTFAQPFFLSFLGISAIELNAKACAKTEDLSVKASYGSIDTINWVTASESYNSDIISEDLNLNDTAILTPLGNAMSASISSSTGFPNWLLIEKGGNSLSLGPSGFITIKLPSPIIDKKGFDLEIIEKKDLKEGYMVFVGLDVDPTAQVIETPASGTTPATYVAGTGVYVNHGRPGAGLYWVNISCTGESTESPSLGNNAHGLALNTNLGTQDKFYGSGKFDIGDLDGKCANFDGVSMAKYVRIIDDNEESGYKDNVKYLPYGEASTPTAGADIDSVTVLNHVKLIKPKDFGI